MAIRADMKKRSIRSLIAILCGVLLLPLIAWGQAAADKPSAAPAESPALYREARYQPINRRDPFLNPLLLKKSENPLEETPRGPAPPGIAGMYIAQVNLVGTSVGEGTQTAVFLGKDQRVYFLRNRDRLFDGYIKTIAADHVVLVRETHLRSGRILTEEVTKRLRTP